MVQTSNEQSGKANVETRGGLKYFESENKNQKYSGWYWCYERKAYYRWDQFLRGEKNGKHN